MPRTTPSAGRGLGDRRWVFQPAVASAASPVGLVESVLVVTVPGHHVHVDVTTLEREVYSEPDAAEILRVPQATLHWWLEGGKRRNTMYPPVIRPEPTGSRVVTWAEFVEAGLLRQYRRELDVRLRDIRAFIAKLRDREGIPYPLAHYRPWVGEGRRLLLELQQESDLPGELWLVAPASDQVVLTEPAASFLRRVEWDADLPVAWRPHEDEASPVRCRPTKRFGLPSIGGISTAAIVEHLDGGEDEADVAEQFGLSLDEVHWARAYELPRGAPAAA
ncbi:MAG: hypothetical protein M3133_07605 [Actinomycetota bacterium]|nr:hypothetical protein [Actinomycetota bacterium]